MSKVYVSEDIGGSLKYEVVGNYIIISHKIFRDGWLVCQCTNYNEAIAIANILTIEGKKDEPVRRRKITTKKSKSNKKSSNPRKRIR